MPEIGTRNLPAPVAQRATGLDQRARSGGIELGAESAPRREDRVPLETNADAAL